MKKRLFVGLTTGVFLIGTFGIVGAVPIEYDLLFTSNTGVTYDLGFVIDTDADGVAKTQGGAIVRAYDDSPGTYDTFYHTISRIGKEQVTEENWFEVNDGDVHTDLFLGGFYYNTLEPANVLIESAQDAWELGSLGPSHEALAGYQIRFYGVTVFDDLWYTQVDLITLFDWGTPDSPLYTTEGGGNFAITPSATVPEPTTMLLFGAGLVGLAGARFRKKKK